MEKDKAIELLGGTRAKAARALGVTYQAVNKWPPVLPARISDRVIAALVRQNGSGGQGLPELAREAAQ